MQPNLPNTGKLYAITSDSYGDETATFVQDFPCILERTDTHTQSGQETSAGGSTVFAEGTFVDVKGKLLLIDSQWYRVVDEFQPLRNLFETAIHHVELSVQRVLAPEVVV